MDILANFINHFNKKRVMQKSIKSFDNTKISYSITKASNQFLVFLHGAGGDSTAWKKERAFFHKKGYSAIAIDLRGHGMSGRPELPEDYRLENFARDVYGVIKKEKIRNFVIIGHCFGGMVAMMFYKLFPSLAKAYILVDTAHKSPSRLWIFKSNFMKHIVNYILENEKIRKKHFSHVNFEKFLGTGDWNFRRIYSDIMHTSLKSWLFTYESMARFNGIKILKRMKRPVLVIEGLEDSIFNVKIARRIHKLINNSEMILIPEANHILVINNVGVLEKDILNYLRHIGF
jgi:pimeloyl-ACP methyl ester carboxylesterase